MLVFLRHLIKQLDEERPGWREDTIILLDGARYHTGEDIREYIHKMQQLLTYIYRHRCVDITRSMISTVQS